MPSRYFTLEEANGLVPWLRETFGRLAPLVQKANHDQRELLGLLRDSKRNGGSNTEAQIKTKQEEVNELTGKVNRILREVADRGVVVRDMERGLVDFPCLREGHEIYLCWTLGEDDVRFWHEIDAGFAGRRPL